MQEFVARKGILVPSGNVGIGTTTPLVKLQSNISTSGLPATSGTTQTNGALRLSSAGTSGVLDFGINSSNNWIQSTDGTDLSQKYNLLLNPNGGNVGIGTTSPTQKLSIGGVGSAISFDTTGASGTSLIQTVLDYELSIKNNRGTSSEIRVGNEVLNFFTNSSERMRINSAGNVLIGTTSGDGYKLQIVGNSQASSTFGITYSTVAAYSQWINSSGAFVMGLDASAGATERMRINSAGNVLINSTSTIASKLVVASSTSTSASYSAIFASSSGSDILDIRGDGLITMPFLVSVFTTGNAANVWTNPSNGDLYRSTSSIKYKKNVENYTKGLTELMQLRPVSYEGKSEVDAGKTFAGLIAEEVHELGLTEYVQYSDDGSPNALSYQNMVAILIKSVQELKNELETLKNK
jgi:hypothetical protein